MSILSTPTPARPIAFKFLPALMTSAVTLVLLLTSKASYLFIVANSSVAVKSQVYNLLLRMRIEFFYPLH